MCASVKDEDIISDFLCVDIFQRIEYLISMGQRRVRGFRRRRGSQSELLRTYGNNTGKHYCQNEPCVYCENIGCISPTRVMLSSTDSFSTIF